MKLLIVDDEHYIVNYLAALILEHAGEDLEVYKCYSGIEAMDLAKTMKLIWRCWIFTCPDYPALIPPPASPDIIPTAVSFFLRHLIILNTFMLLTSLTTPAIS